MRAAFRILRQFPISAIVIRIFFNPDTRESLPRFLRQLICIIFTALDTDGAKKYNKASLTGSNKNDRKKIPKIPSPDRRWREKNAPCQSWYNKARAPCRDFYGILSEGKTSKDL